MCVLLNTLPKRSKTAGTSKHKSLVIPIKPCPDKDGEKTWYRFRLLNFAAKNTDRDYPFIERFVHQHWKINEKGFSEIEDEVVCPVTKWVNWEGNRYDTCPICKYAGKQFVILKESNYKDADARKKNREFSRKYQGIVPVYVVNDPNNEANNGQFKVLMFGDKKVYDTFVKKVEVQLLKHNCFNGKDAVDFCLHMTEVPEVRNEGQPNEYIYKSRVIDKMLFSSTPKDLPAITPQAIDERMPLDATYYVSSTKDELKAFYDKYIKISNDDIIDDGDELKIYEKPTNEAKDLEKSVIENSKEEKPSNDDIEDVDVSDSNTLLNDPDEEGLEVTEPTKTENAKNLSANDDISDEEMKKIIDTIEV